MKLAWCFPGQGSQFVGMGRELCEASIEAREIFLAADDALGLRISRLCFEGPESELTLTRNTQPAILSMSMALLAALRGRVPNLPPPAFAAGHSLGEYSALVAACALPFRDAVRLVQARGEAMQSAVPPGVGAMAAIMGLSPERVAQLCEEAASGEVVAPANFNAPGQIVIAGHVDAVARTCKLVTSSGGKAIPLKVSAPFHCFLMTPAEKVVAEQLAQLPIGPFSFPVIANLDALPNTDPTRVSHLLVRQVDHPVLWEQSVRRMEAEGVTHILEIGPGKVLSGLVKRTAKSIVPLAVGDIAGVDEVARLIDKAIHSVSHEAAVEGCDV